MPADTGELLRIGSRRRRRLRAFEHRPRLGRRAGAEDSAQLPRRDGVGFEGSAPGGGYAGAREPVGRHDAGREHDGAAHWPRADEGAIQGAARTGGPASGQCHRGLGAREPAGSSTRVSGYPDRPMAQATKTTGAENVRWNLTDLFKSPTDPAIEKTLADALKRAQAFEARYKGKVTSLPPKEFAAMMRELEEDEELATKPDVYAYLLHSQNTEDNAAGRLLARVREAGAERGSHGVFFTLELAQVSDEQAGRLYADPESAKYRHMVEEARKFRPHQLSEPEERVLTDFSPVGNAAWNRLFEELCARISVDLDSRQMPLEEALVRLREADRKVRREASGAITTALAADVKTRGYIFNVILGEKAIDDRLRHFPTWISSRNLANETSDEAVQA